MKRPIYSSIFALCGMLAACVDTIEVPQDEYDAPAKIQLSTPKLVFGVDGGSTVVIVATNTEEWSYTTQGDWFTVAKEEDNLRIEVSANGTPEAKSGSITVTGVKNDEEVSATAEIVQRTGSNINLSADGTANSYIAGTGGQYKFDATVKGNGGEGDGQSTYIDKHGVEITGIAYVDLLWEARNDGDKTLSREIIDGIPTYGDGYISFSTGRSQGNALIAAYDVKGNILWSWHIWVLDDEIEVNDHANETGVIGRIMDRNLGAMNNEPMDVNNRGLFYQWGRKDPFPASRTPYVTSDPAGYYNVPENNVPNSEVGNGSGSWIYHQPASPEMNVPGNIPYATQNPMTYITPFANVNQWFCVDKDSPMVQDSKLWDVEKTIFDPCPVGYRVPGPYTWGNASGDRTIRNGGAIAEYDENGEHPDYDWNVWKDCGRTWKYTGDYYPAVGTVSINEASINANTGVYGMYWTTQHRPTVGAHYTGYFIYNWAECFAMEPVYSAQVRCMKE